MITLAQKIESIAAANDSLAAAKASQASAVSALMVAAAPDDHCLAVGESVADLAGAVVYGNVEGKLTVLALRGYVSPPPAPATAPASVPAP